uniref:Putative SEC-C motif contining protein n=1 Tax=viral metagenome TaxID=1070528 RepID=A0A6M3MBL6_9ZZZZ
MSKRGLKPKSEGTGRNQLCRCHSGKKYKHCHGDQSKGTAALPVDSPTPPVRNTTPQNMDQFIREMKLNAMRDMHIELRNRKRY